MEDTLRIAFLSTGLSFTDLLPATNDSRGAQVIGSAK